MLIVWSSFLYTVLIARHALATAAAKRTATEAGAAADDTEDSYDDQNGYHGDEQDRGN